jgi:CubicO group peptidase (beta-lactamase class C family)
VERVSGSTLREFAAAEIFGPLEMNATRFKDKINQLVVNRADGYQKMPDGSWEIYMTNLSRVGDGDVYTTIDDFIKWDRKVPPFHLSRCPILWGHLCIKNSVST